MSKFELSKNDHLSIKYLFKSFTHHGYITIKGLK